MAKKIREFMTPQEPPEHIWMERDESAVIGTARMGREWCREFAVRFIEKHGRFPVTERG